MTIGKAANFFGNTERIINSIPQEDRVDMHVRDLALGQDRLPIEKTLVVIWCIESGTFRFRMNLRINTVRTGPSFQRVAQFNQWASLAQ